MDRISTLFDSLDHWRHFPAYQLERRADIFFSLYLDEIFKSYFGENIGGVIPEFPVRKGSIQTNSESNRSFKIDYLVKLKNRDKVLLVELKTDSGSRRKNQDRYLQEVKSVGFEKILQGVLMIYAATKAKSKYRCLLDELTSLGFLKKLPDHKYATDKTQCDIDIVYIQPEKKEGSMHVISFQDIAEIVARNSDELSQRFAESLRQWAARKAGNY